MRRIVRQRFVAFTVPFEGAVPFMYLDQKGLVTTAIGNLIDPESQALGVPFRKPDGTLATQAEIVAEWERVKALQHLRLQGGMIFRHYTTLRLDPQGIEQVVFGRLDLHDARLRARFPDFEDWPADAQLATHSMAWACGAAFRFPMLERALRARDFAIAALECKIHPDTGTITQRNLANRILYRNASRVISDRLDPEMLFYPRDLAQGSAEFEAPTLPKLSDDSDPEGTETKPVPMGIVHPPLEFPPPDDEEPKDE